MAIGRGICGAIGFCIAGALFTSTGNTQEADAAAAWRQFEIAGKLFSVNPDSDGDGKRSYEVLVEEGGLAVARLSVNRNGVLSDAWQTDLDNDGNPEIIVAVGQLNGMSRGAADVHEWDGYKFVSRRGPDNVAAEPSYDGHDQFALKAGQLMREFPKFRDEGGARVPAGETASYRYDMATSQWIAN